MMKDVKEPNDPWMRLDNAAKIYPAVKDKQLTSVFRVSVVLKERIKVRELIAAVHSIEKRFPYYKVKLKAGFFWYYLDPYDIPIALEPDVDVPCRAFEKDELMFRVLARDHKISVEFSHILTDGTGAFEFLKTLLTLYLEKCGMVIPGDFDYLHAGEIPHPGEFEDGYNRYFKKIHAGPVKIPRAFHLPYERSAAGFNTLTFAIPLGVIKEKARSCEISLTEYLTAVYLFALQQVFEQQTRFRKKIKNKILRIEVPINLRKAFPSKTMRNFSLYVMPGIDLRLGMYSFEEIAKTVYHKMQLETDKKLISKMISRNVSGERNPFIRGIPLFLKSLILARLYKLGTGQYSGVVTNLGKIELPPEISRRVDKFIFIPPPPNRLLKLGCGVCGFGDELIVTFGNITVSKELERCFARFLVSEGIPVKIIKV